MNPGDNSVITKGRLANKYFIMVFIVSLCLNLDQNLFNNSVTLYLTHLGASAQISGMIGVPFAICAITARIIGGYMADHIGRRLTMALGCLIFGLAALLFGFTGSFVLLFILRGLHGFGYSLTNTPVSAATMDTCPPEKQKTASGLFYLPSAITVAICGTIVVTFTDRGKFTELFILAGAVLLAGGVIALLCNYEKLMSFKADKSESSEKYRGLSKFFDLCAVKSAVLAGVCCLATAFIIAFILLYAQKRGFSNSGLFFTISAVVMLVMNLSIDLILKKLREMTVLVISFAFLGGGLILLGLTGAQWAYYFLGFCYGLCFGTAFPVLYSLALRNARPERRGAASGTVLVANDIGIGVGSALWGVVISAAGYSAGMIIAGVVALAGIVLSAVFFGKKAA